MAAGIFAFIIVIGVLPRVLVKTQLANSIMCIENVVVFGVLFGGIISVQPQLSLGTDNWSRGAGQVFLLLYGLFAGIYVGCISAALAEIMRAIPMLFRRISLYMTARTEISRFISSSL